MEKIAITSIKYAYFDMDGTILDDQGKLIPENLQAILRLQNANVKIGIATGRPHYLIKAITSQINLDLPVINNDGTEIYDLKSATSEIIGLIDKNVLKQIGTYLHNHQLGYKAYTNEKIYAYTPNGPVEHQGNREAANYPKENLSSVEQLVKLPILKLMTIVWDPVLFQKVWNHFISIPKLFVRNSNNFLIDLTPDWTSKGYALKLLEKRNIIDCKNLLAFGDNENDRIMVQYAKYGVIMGNASASLKEITPYIAKPNTSAGVAKFINEMIDFNK